MAGLIVQTPEEHINSAAQLTDSVVYKMLKLATQHICL